MAEQSLSLLNAFEILVDGGTRHVICFLDPVLAGAKGIEPQWLVGEITPGPDGDFDASRFVLNPDFIRTLTDYMNDVAAQTPALVAQANARPSEWLYVLDPRYRGPTDEPPGSEVLGCFGVDDTGRIAPGSFQYNQHHVWFEPSFGVSGLLGDRRFYAWVHGQSEN
ncbi:MAG: hypothetical protein P4L84_04260 [Isosphaeraceae bacterium]|nr:hypothetical protein [Isosphaeraceae bacterium]